MYYVKRSATVSLDQGKAYTDSENTGANRELSSPTTTKIYMYICQHSTTLAFEDELHSGQIDFSVVSEVPLNKTSSSTTVH